MYVLSKSVSVFEDLLKAFGDNKEATYFDTMGWMYVLTADIVIAYICRADIGMIYIVMDDIVMACIGPAYIGMACKVVGYVVMAAIVMDLF